MLQILNQWSFSIQNLTPINVVLSIDLTNGMVNVKYIININELIIVIVHVNVSEVKLKRKLLDWVTCA